MRIKPTTRFKRDLQRCQKRGYQMELLKAIIDCLDSGQPLDAKWKNHRLMGDYEGTQECHIQPD
jgi:mRNA interferase YafQ